MRKNGDICLAVRLTCLSLASVVRLYDQSLLPRMHYVQPFTVAQFDSLRTQSMSIVAEVLEYLLDADTHLWSIRRSKANFFCVTALLSGGASTLRWFVNVCHWRSLQLATTILVDARLSCAKATNTDELDEELDTFPTSRFNDVVRVRYDRLRTVAGRIQTVVADVETQGRAGAVSARVEGPQGDGDVHGALCHVAFFTWWRSSQGCKLGAIGLQG
uniref:OO_Ba0013J05-OO_Ba0033A15.17 protein n=1 Tax=Oryza officinalis TaxID=4535 RepID=D0ABG0_9ORYZ|nr:OO_Ba0013J05-OO_Ba0033A15.17 [Oryza officinalis]